MKVLNCMGKHASLDRECGQQLQKVPKAQNDGLSYMEMSPVSDMSV